MWYGTGMGGWGFGLMVVGAIVFWASVVTGSVLLVRYLTSSPQPPAPPRGPVGPRQILAERYARGEISDDEFARRMRTLDSHADV
ncbi:SHOCT domain-containing protein [Nocardia sp. NPDC003963]